VQFQNGNGAGESGCFAGGFDIEDLVRTDCFRGRMRNSRGIETSIADVYLNFYFRSHSGNRIESKHSTYHF
jgi:hypothetical protein